MQLIRTIEEKLAGNDKPVEGAKEGLEAANNVAECSDCFFSKRCSCSG